MKSLKSFSDRKKQAAYILGVLAEKIPDQILQEYFNDLSPEQVRKTLQETSAIINPVTEKGAPPPQSHHLLQEPGSPKEWQGKLKGRSLNLYTDGASRGNPGEAGAGIAILDEQGNELVGTGDYLGQCTNNEAEYRALLLGLTECGKFGYGRVNVHLDSELIVKQILGEYRVKHPNLVPLYRETMQRLSHFASYSITHVRREKNSRADWLANQAIDERGK
ncbi:MAG: ribonuclease HI family protein [Desulfobulbales bacterium]|nr:ribonuclease HI family protein [Desulfobulbales bacterium]